MTRGENAYKEAKTAGMVVRAGGDRECGKASGPGHRIHLSWVESGRVETEEPRLVSRAQLQCQHPTGSSPHWWCEDEGYQDRGHGGGHCRDGAEEESDLEESEDESDWESYDKDDDILQVNIGD